MLTSFFVLLSLNESICWFLLLQGNETFHSILWSLAENTFASLCRVLWSISQSVQAWTVFGLSFCGSVPQNKCIDNCSFKQEKCEIAIPPTRLHRDAIVIPLLVGVIHTAHVLVVFTNTWRCRNVLQCPIVPSSLNCVIPTWLAATSKKINNVLVLPSTSRYAIMLHRKIIIEVLHCRSRFMECTRP